MMKFKLKILTIFFFSAFTIPITADETSYDFSSLSNFLQKEIKKGRYPGFLTLIQKDGKLIYSEVLGYNDVKNKIPLKRDSLFRIYSMTKRYRGSSYDCC